MIQDIMRNFISNVYEMRVKNKPTEKFPLERERWLEILDGSQVTCKEIKLIAEWCKCKQSELLLSHKQYENLGMSLSQKAKEFFEVEQNELDFQNTMRILGVKECE